MKVKYLNQRPLIQGDVILKPIAELPTGLTRINYKGKKGKTLQESEVTGHHHWFQAGAAVDVYQAYDSPLHLEQGRITPDFGKFIEIKDDNTIHLFHGKGFEKEPAKTGTGDHNALEINPSYSKFYQVDIRREYDYEKDEMARVTD